MAPRRGKVNLSNPLRDGRKSRRSSSNLSLFIRLSAQLASASAATATALLLLCCCCSLTLASPTTPQPTTFSAPPKGKPPRGYCTHISRAIPASSLCYDHLIRDRYAFRESVSSTTAGSAGLKNNAYNQTTTTTTTTTMSTRDGQRHSRPMRREEELVYVRLETVGGSIQDLNTQAINERLLQGVYRQLLQVEPSKEASSTGGDRGGGGGARGDDAVLGGGREGGTDDLEDIRAQILSPPQGTGEEGQRLADKCRLSMEKFLCRMAYPSCHFRHKDVSALVRPPCREDCYLLRDVFCSNLNWSKFARSLVGAFNLTLMSMINELDLASQGDLPLPVPELKQPDTLSQRVGTATDPITTTHTPEGHHLNSSIHYYWPHEHSIQNCDSLPAIRSIHKPSSGSHIAASEQTYIAGDGARVGERYHSFFHANDQLPLPRKQVEVEVAAAQKQQQQHRWPVCSDASLTRVPAPSIYRHNKVVRLRTLQGLPNDCLTSHDGLTYTGTRNHTKSGLSCQAWQDQQPHQHRESELLFENMRIAHNYCRNPGGLEVKPWCYTQDASVRWEYCDITPC